MSGKSIEVRVREAAHLITLIHVAAHADPDETAVEDEDLAAAVATASEMAMDLLLPILDGPGSALNWEPKPKGGAR